MKQVQIGARFARTIRPCSTGVTSMHRSIRLTLTTWPFLLSLAALLLNDLWLKGLYPGFFTGKLSDFAGIALVALLLLACDPAHHWRTVAGIVLAFTWWKSPLSQSFIDAFNAMSHFPIGRVVDYTDLISFAVLPSIVKVARCPRAFQIPGQSLRRALVIPVALLTLLGLTATSLVTARQDYQVRQPDFRGRLDRGAIAGTVARVATRHDLNCEACSEAPSRARFAGNGMTLEYRFVGANVIEFEVEAIPDGLFFGRSGNEKADRLRADLKDELSALHEGLEYVERLGSRSNPCTR